MTTLWSRDREIQEIARKVPDPLSMKAGSGNETICMVDFTSHGTWALQLEIYGWCG